MPLELRWPEAGSDAERICAKVVGVGDGPWVPREISMFWVDAMMAVMVVLGCDADSVASGEADCVVMKILEGNGHFGRLRAWMGDFWAGHLVMAKCAWHACMGADWSGAWARHCQKVFWCVMCLFPLVVAVFEMVVFELVVAVFAKLGWIY